MSPTAAPLVADPVLSTIPVEQLYAIDTPGHGLTSGQRVLVELSLLGGGQRTIIPYAALFYDLVGEMYTSPEPLAFVRHLVRVDYIKDNQVFLLQGPPPGTAVVTVGSAQLYGVETGVGK